MTCTRSHRVQSWWIGFPVSEVTMAHHLTETAVYTIATPERLVHASESGEPIFEKKRWVKAEELYESRQAGAELPLLLSNSRDCSWLIAWTLLTTIKVSDAGTAFTIGSLYQLPRVRPQAIARYPSNERIAERYQRNYVICLTPKFLFEAAKSPQYWPGIKAVKREVREGEQRLARHVKRERNQSIVRELKAARMRENGGRIPCEICGFDFAETYGEMGDGFAEAHHREPIGRAPASGRTTRVEDFALVCSNCHRMLHRGSEFPSIEQVRKRIRLQK